MSPINLIFDVALACGIHLKIYSSFHAHFINPFSAKMFHQDGNLSTVNNNRVVPISSNLPSQMGSWQDRKKAIKSTCSLFICKSVHFFFGKILLNIYIPFIYLFSCALLKLEISPPFIEKLRQ